MMKIIEKRAKSGKSIKMLNIQDIAHFSWIFIEILKASVNYIRVVGNVLI